MSQPQDNEARADAEALGTRWRLVLGKYSQKQLDSSLDGRGKRMDRALEFLYGREYEGRGMRGDGQGNDSHGRGGSLDPSQLNVPSWLNEVRKLFPSETCLTLEKHALENYGLTDLVKDPKFLEQAKPDMDLLKMVLSFKGHMKGEVLEQARRIIREVVEELRKRLEREFQQVISGRANPFKSSPLKVQQNFDWRGTLRMNLKNYDRERKQIVLEHLRFFSRTKRRIPWRLVLCVDQSGSMADSVIHSAVTGAILARLPSVNVKLVLFDTSVIDLSEHAEDPLEVLMGVQLGGGTYIGQALRYCETLIEDGPRTALVLISDFEEGGPPNEMLAAVRRMSESGVTLLGLAALDQQVNPYYDKVMATRLQQHGMEIAALTPKMLVEWLVERMGD